MLESPCKLLISKGLCRNPYLFALHSSIADRASVVTNQAPFLSAFRVSLSASAVADFNQQPRGVSGAHWQAVRLCAASWHLQGLVRLPEPSAGSVRCSPRRANEALRI